MRKLLMIAALLMPLATPRRRRTALAVAALVALGVVLALTVWQIPLAVVVVIALPFGAAGGRRNVFVGVASSIVICFIYFVLQQLDYLEYIDLYHDRIRMFHEFEEQPQTIEQLLEGQVKLLADA